MNEILGLLNKKEPFEADVDLEDLLEILAHPNYLVMKNLSQQIVKFWPHERIIRDVEIKIRDEASLREELLNLLNIKEEVQINYDYVNYKFLPKEALEDYQHFNIIPEQERAIRSLYNFGNSEEAIPLRFKLKRDSLTEYDQVLDYPAKKAEAFWNKKVAGVIIGLSMLFGPQAMAKMDEGPKQSPLKIIQTNSSKTFQNIDDVSSTLVKSHLPHSQKMLKTIAGFTALEKEVISSSSFSRAIEDFYAVNPPHYRKIKDKVDQIHAIVVREAKKHDIDPTILFSIIKTESDFDNTKVSTTKDYSLVQINPMWNEEFKRLKREPLDLERLKKDPEYAVSRMAEILSIHKKQYSKDPYWFARYHSKTPSLKKTYGDKVLLFSKYLDSYQNEELQNKLSKLMVLVPEVEEELVSLGIDPSPIDSLKSKIADISKGLRAIASND